MLSGPIKRAAVPALAVRAVSNNTGDGMRRIANDVTSLTQVNFYNADPPASLGGKVEHLYIFMIQYASPSLEVPDTRARGVS